MMMNKMNKNNVYLTVKYKLWLKKEISEINSLKNESNINQKGNISSAELSEDFLGNAALKRSLNIKDACAMFGL